MNTKPYYPVGIQDFAKLRKLNAVYVDKTDLVYKLANTSSSVFLSRPRRFGKSLLSSTLACYFEGRKELFEGLAIEKLEKDWIKHPVLHFDLSAAKNMPMSGVTQNLSFQLDQYEQIYGDKYATAPLGTRLSALIVQAHQQTGQQVAVIIDEYDAPILSLLHEKESMQEVRVGLREFFAPLKMYDKYLCFVFITGISTFSQLSIFSELNNLKIISNSDEYATICGISEQELVENFEYGINDLASTFDCSADEMLDKLKHQYDGYHFSDAMVDIYNPFSLLNSFDMGKMESFWFTSGTPTFLIEMLKKYRAEHQFDLDALESPEPVSSSTFTTSLEEYSGPIPLLYQSGYLTLKEYLPKSNQYILGIPNSEVRVGLLKSLIPLFFNIDKNKVVNSCDTASACLRDGECDKALELLQSLLSGIPFMKGDKDILEDEEKTEAYYHRLFFFYFSMLNNEVSAEVRSSRGAADIVVKTKKYIYVFEIKINSSAEAALSQIEEKGYAEPYNADERKVVKVGVNFSTEKRTLDSWKLSE